MTTERDDGISVGWPERGKERAVDDERGMPDGAEAEDVRVESKLVGSVRGRDVTITTAAAGIVAADGAVSVHNGGCGPVFAKGGMTLTNGGCGPVVASGDVSITNGGTQSILAAGGATIGPRAFVGFVVSPAVTVEDGGRVLFGLREAAVFGAIAGILFGILSRASRK
jgi:hypothetical protein